MRLMKRMAVPLLLLTTAALFAPFVRSSPASPPPPSNRRYIRPDAAERQRAQDLYQLTKKEHRSLHWDECLARKAFLRAKQLSIQGYFEHEDPRTGENPAWQMVRNCYEGLRSAGENLAKGEDTPENIHKALMSSATHRKNIMDPHFERIGVGCFDDVCVELFAGF